jgi:hypothetical protein
MEIVDGGVSYAVPHLRLGQTVLLPMTKEDFDEAYVVWKCGGSYQELAKEYGVPANTLAWALVMRIGGTITNYDVHYRPTNK